MARKKKREKRVAKVTGQALVVRDLKYAFLWVLIAILLTGIFAVIGNNFFF